MAKPTIIIVPGAWQMPPAFDNIVKLLQDAGYPTVHVPLPTVGGTELPLAGLSDDVNAVRKVLIPIVEDGKQVVVIGHSAGGISMSGAVEGYDLATRKAAGKAGGVVRCIFMTAFVLPKGQSLLGMLGGQPLPWMVVKEDRVIGDPEMLPQVGLNDLSPEEQTKWAAGMTHTSAALFASPALYEPWANGIPCSYIFHTEDNALPLAYQQGMAQLLGPEAKTVTLKAGHCSFLSIPDQLVEAIESIISVSAGHL